MQTKKIADILKGALLSLLGLLLLLNTLGFVKEFATVVLILLSLWLVIQGLYLAGLIDLIKDYWTKRS